jgi:hypothetical protein
MWLGKFPCHHVRLPRSFVPEFGLVGGERSSAVSACDTWQLAFGVTRLQGEGWAHRSGSVRCMRPHTVS